MAQWRSDTDRIAHAKMRRAADTMRQQSEAGESLLSRIPFKLIFVLLLVVAHARWALAVADNPRPAVAAELLARRPLLAPGPALRLGQVVGGGVWGHG